jgi:Flp pilus assembly protein TadD
MLDALKTAPDEQSAAQLEQAIEHSWLSAASPAVTLLISRGLRLLQAGETGGAVQSFSDAITLQPDVAEVWRQRAVARYQAGDVAGAVHDLEQTIKLQPRAFNAFRTLADIATARQDWKSAYAAWTRLMEIDPKTPGGADRLRDLKRRVEGEQT